MADNLWDIRRRKKLKVRDLAAKSGVPAAVIHRYEAGEKPISPAHLRQLARALIVETWDIKPVSEPKPRAPEATGRERPTRQPVAPKAPRPPRPPAPVRPSQIQHLLNLAQHFPGLDRASFEERVGKPLEELTQKEASQLLSELQERLRQEQPGVVKHPFDRHRAYLPEGVDEFELRYLTAAQAAGESLRVTLFDGAQVEGQIIGFNPYALTLRQSNGDEITVNKLAIAYYRKQGNQP